MPTRIQKPSRAKWEPGAAWNILILFLSGYVVLAFAFSFLPKADPEVIKFLGYGDTIACLFFLADLFLRFMAAPNRIAFWKYAWIDLISSIPNFVPMRWAILFKALRILRAMRVIVSTIRIADYLFENKVKSFFAAAVSAMFASIFACGVLVLYFERQAQGATIRNAFDAIWWSVNTVTTVGTGDIYPITDEGRILGMLLMFVGISLFSTCSGMTAMWFLRAFDKQTQVYQNTQPISQLEDLSKLPLQSYKKKNSL